MLHTEIPCLHPTCLPACQPASTLHWCIVEPININSRHRAQVQTGMLLPIPHTSNMWPQEYLYIVGYAASQVAHLVLAEGLFWTKLLKSKIFHEYQFCYIHAMELLHHLLIMMYNVCFVWMNNTSTSFSYLKSDFSYKRFDVLLCAWWNYFLIHIDVSIDIEWMNITLSLHFCLLPNLLS